MTPLMKKRMELGADAHGGAGADVDEERVPSGTRLQSPQYAPRWVPTIVDMVTADAMECLKRGQY